MAVVDKHLVFKENDQDAKGCSYLLLHLVPYFIRKIFGGVLLRKN